MYCQSCGASNAPEARFCHMCGAAIAPAGAPGGPAEATSSGPSAADITLARIGVRSSKGVWITLGVVAAGLVALGAVGTRLIRGDGAASSEGGHAQVDDPFVIGAPLPRGAATPGEDFLEEPPPPAPEPAGSEAGSATRLPAPSRTRTATERSTAPQERQAQGPSAGEQKPSGPPPSPAPPAEESAGSGETALAMDLYGARVRYVVQRYYASRAQGCFDRATRNNPGVSGTVVVSLSIRADGQVRKGSVIRNTTGDAELGACLAAQVGSWKLPPPPGGAAEMEMPFSR
jgi:hypothetical protein